MKKILYVDQEKSYSNKLALYLKSAGYDLTVTDSTENAQRLVVSPNKPDIFITDQKYYETFKDLKPIDVKHIILTDDKDFSEKASLADLRVEEVIYRSKDVELVKLVVDEILTPYESTEDRHTKYYGVQIEDLINIAGNHFSLYLKINDKYVCFLKAGQEFTGQKYKLLSDKGMKIIYLNSKDYASYTDMQFTQKSKSTQRPLQQAIRQKVSQFFQNRLSTNSLISAINKENAERALTQVQNYAMMAMENESLGKALSQMIEETPSLAEKSSLVATVSSCVADLWKWNSPKIQSRIVMGSLVCDIGLKDHPELIGKKKIELTREEAKIYDEHPVRSYKMLSQIKDIPEEILQIAIQHHENSVGSGFPQKLVRNQIHSFAKLIHGVHEFVETLFGPKGMLTPAEALQQLMTMQRKIVSEQVIKSLYKLFNLIVPKELEQVLLPDKSGMVV